MFVDKHTNTVTKSKQDKRQHNRNDKKYRVESCPDSQKNIVSCLNFLMNEMEKGVIEKRG